ELASSVLPSTSEGPHKRSNDHAIEYVWPVACRRILHFVQDDNAAGSRRILERLVRRRVTFLRVKIKRALTETGIARFLPPHSCAEKLLEHFLLESANNGILIEHILERRVAFQNLRA